jgi:hypothetical protein
MRDSQIEGVRDHLVTAVDILENKHFELRRDEMKERVSEGEEGGRESFVC